MAYNFQLVNGNLCDATEVMSDLNQLGILADANTATGVWLFNNPIVRGTGTAATLVISSTSTTTDSVVSLQRNYAEKWKLMNDNATNNFLIQDIVGGTSRIILAQPVGTIEINGTAIYRPTTSGGTAILDRLFYRHVASDLTGGTADQTITTYTQKASASVPANTVSNDIFIALDYFFQMVNTGANGGVDFDVLLEINGTTARTWEDTAGYSSAAGAGSLRTRGTLVHRFTPSAAQKTSGFDVLGFCRIANLGANTTGSIGFSRLWVTGN